MAIGVILTGPGVSKEQYQQTFQEIASDQTAPAGLRYHLAGATPDGMCIVEVWESRDALNAFFGSRVKPVMDEAGIVYEPSFFDVVNEITV